MQASITDKISKQEAAFLIGMAMKVKEGKKLFSIILNQRFNCIARRLDS